MPKRSRPIILFSTLTSLLIALPVEALGASASVANATGNAASSTSDAPAETSAAEKAKQATALFRAGKFEQALMAFDKALAVTNDHSERATLEFNAASCLFELGRYDAARSRFLKAAELDPSLASAARLQAAASAFKLGDLPGARRLLDEIQTDNPDLVTQKKVLLESIDEQAKKNQRTAFLAKLMHAEKVVSRGDPERGLTELRGLLAFEPIMTQAELGDVHHSIAVLLIKLGRHEEGTKELDIAGKFAPSDPDIQLTRARAAREQGDDAMAQQSYERSLTLGIDRDGKAEAEAGLEALKPLPRTGWHGVFSLGGGYDTNPRQSGTASVSSVGNRGRGGSFYTAAMADFGYTGSLGADARLRAFYYGDWLGMTKQSVRDVTLQTHGLGLRLDYAPTPRLTLRATLASSMSWSGQQPIEPFVFEVMSGLRANYQTSRTGFARLNLEARRISGFTNWEFLGGTRLDAELSHGWQSTSWSVRGGARARLNDIGTRTLAVVASDFPSCGARCNGATYLIPLAYAGTGPFLAASVSPGSDVWLHGYASFDYRRYTESSQITGVPESAKRRVDNRTTLEASLDIPLAFDGHLRAIPTYTFLLSRSNIALNPTDPYYRFDYDNRSFTQQLVELSLEARF
jgi:tetratricopeptide (TPR) repeat protein